MPKGTVKWYNEAKGYGFILSEKGEELFVHRTGLANSYDGLQPDQNVSFNIEQGKKGLMAVDVESKN
jgi:cold shock protein